MLARPFLKSTEDILFIYQNEIRALEAGAYTRVIVLKYQSHTLPTNVSFRIHKSSKDATYSFIFPSDKLPHVPVLTTEGILLFDSKTNNSLLFETAFLVKQGLKIPSEKTLSQISSSIDPLDLISRWNNLNK